MTPCAAAPAVTYDAAAYRLLDAGDAADILKPGDVVTHAGTVYRVEYVDCCPYVVPPAEYAEYGTRGAWVYLWRAGGAGDAPLADWVPVETVESEVG